METNMETKGHNTKGCKSEMPAFGYKFSIKDVHMSYVGKNNMPRTKGEIQKIEMYLKEHGINEKEITVSEWYGDSKKGIERSINGIAVNFSAFECDINGIICVGFIDENIEREGEVSKVMNEYNKKYGIVAYNNSMNFEEWNADYQKKKNEMINDPKYQEAIKRAQEENKIINKCERDNSGKRPIYIFHTHIDYNNTAYNDIDGSKYTEFTKELKKTARQYKLKMELNSDSRSYTCLRSPYLDPIFYTVGGSFDLGSFKQFLRVAREICEKYAVRGCDMYYTMYNV